MAKQQNGVTYDTMAGIFDPNGARRARGGQNSFMDLLYDGASVGIPQNDKTIMDKALTGLMYAATAANSVYNAPQGTPGIVPALAGMLQLRNRRQYNRQLSDDQAKHRKEIAGFGNRYFGKGSFDPEGTVMSVADLKNMSGMQGNLDFGRASIEQQLGGYPASYGIAPSNAVAKQTEATLKQEAANARNTAPLRTILPAYAVGQALGQPGVQHSDMPFLGDMLPPPAPIQQTRAPEGKYAQMNTDHLASFPPDQSSQPELDNSQLPPSYQPGQQQPGQYLAGGVSREYLDPPTINPFFRAKPEFKDVANVVNQGAGNAVQQYRAESQDALNKSRIHVDAARIKKLEEETQWLGPKAKAYIANMTRPRGGGGNSRAFTKIEVAQQMLKNGDITPQEYKQFILGAAGKSGVKKGVSPQTLKTLGDLKSGYDDSKGWGPFGWGGDSDSEQYYADTYNSIADQNGMPRLPGKNKGGNGGRLGKSDFMNAAGGGRR